MYPVADCAVSVFVQSNRSSSNNDSNFEEINDRPLPAMLGAQR